MDIPGKSVNGRDRMLRLEADRESPSGEKWVSITVYVKDKAYTVRVPTTKVREAMDLAGPK